MTWSSPKTTPARRRCLIRKRGVCLADPLAGRVGDHVVEDRRADPDLGRDLTQDRLVADVGAGREERAKQRIRQLELGRRLGQAGEQGVRRDRVGLNADRPEHERDVLACARLRHAAVDDMRLSETAELPLEIERPADAGGREMRIQQERVPHQPGPGFGKQAPQPLERDAAPRADQVGHEPDRGRGPRRGARGSVATARRSPS